MAEVEYDNYGNPIAGASVVAKDKIRRTSGAALTTGIASLGIGIVLLLFGLIQLGVYKGRKSRAVVTKRAP